MPRVKIDYVVSFSSEDPENAANNLLNWEVSKKRWLCAKGEPSCSVVLQLTKAVMISAVHIGSHHSALVEVLVGRSEKPNDPFEVLVPSSIFLTPASSRGSEAVERVRSFSAEQLGPARAQRWDRVRVVCSQPYNKHCKFGLSFVQIYEPESEAPSAAPPPASQPPQSTQPRLSAISAHSHDSDSDEFRPGELFAKHRTTDTGVQIRQATSHALKNIDDSSTKLVKTPIAKHSHKRVDEVDSACGSRQRDELLYTDEGRPHGKIDRIIQQNKDLKARDKDAADKHGGKDRNVKTKEENADRNAKVNKEEKELNRSKTTDSVKYRSKKESPSSMDKERRARDKSKERPSSSNNSDEARRSEKKKRPCDDEEPEMPLESVLSGVVFVLSGYQNPERAAVRQLAVDMGAQYRRDWGPSCNTLVCAFPNTPKLQQVRSSPGGRDVPVVTADWLKECHDARRRLPPPGSEPATPRQRRHSDDGDTDDEIERAMKKKRRRLNSSDEDAATKRDDDAATTSNDNALAKSEDDTEMTICDDSTKQDDDEDATICNDSSKPDDDATIICDDVAATRDDDSQHDSDDATDVEELPRRERIDRSACLPPLFEGRSFLVGGARGDLLRRYIAAYGGLLLQESDIDEDSRVDFVVGANEKRHGGQRRPPSWVWRCHAHQRLLPH